MDRNNTRPVYVTIPVKILGHDLGLNSWVSLGHFLGKINHKILSVLIKIFAKIQDYGPHISCILAKIFKILCLSWPR